MKQEDIDEIIKIVKQNLRKDDNLTPVFFLERREGGKEIIVTPFAEEKEKEITQALVSKMLKTGNYKSYVFAMDGWYSTDLEKRPSENPNKKEALIVNYHEDGNKPMMYFIPYTRTKQGRIKFEEMTTSDKIGGTFAELWN